MAPVVWCLVAAALFGASTPFAGALLDDIDPWFLAGLLYLGAALATLPFSFRGGSSQARWSGRNVRALGGAVFFGGIAGPVLLLFGLQQVSLSAASLWLNLETVATSILALVLFRESIDRTTWLALALITGAGVVLAVPFDPGTTTGALLIAAACVCWGLDNNFTSVIDGWTPTQSTAVKGLVAGGVNLAIGRGDSIWVLRDWEIIGTALVVGALGYGASIVLYIRGAQQLGASRSQLLFATAPFAGVAVAVLLFGESLTWPVVVGGALMAGGLVLLQREQHGHVHRHDAVMHTHRHRHDDGHHDHDHDGVDPRGWHTHEHGHDAVEHEHPHRPDLHHRHVHLLLAGLLALAALVLPSPADAVTPPGVRTRLIVEGEPRPGAELPVRVEVSWPGRPEKFQPGVPKLRVPEEGAVRLGGTGSSFARGRTAWWTDTVVTLPDWDGPWMIGPATLALADARGAAEDVQVAAKRIRPKRNRGLLGRGLGSTVVLLFAGLWMLRLYRRLGETPAAQDRDRRATLVDTCTRAYEAESTVEFLRAAIALRKQLEGDGTAPDEGPDAAALAERLDGVRFGGEEMNRDACRVVLEPLVAAARGSEEDV